MSNPTVVLLELRQHYQSILAQSESQAVQAKAQLAHIDALLLDSLLQELPTEAEATSSPPLQALAQAPALPAAALAPAPATKASRPRQSKAAPEPAAGKRSPRPLLPAYQGLTRLEAIAQLLQSTLGLEVTTDGISESLFGNLSSAEHKAERKSLNTQLSKGVVQKLWQKGTAPATFLMGKPTASKGNQTTSTAAAKAPKQPKSKATVAKAPAKAKTAKASAQRKSLPLLPAYAQLTKREAIAQILGQHPGEVLHHDTIIQTLYGDLSPEALREERVRIKTALLTGVKDGKWQKASVPSSYFLESPAAGAKPKRPGRKPDPSKEPIPQPEPVVEAEAAKATHQEYALSPVAKATAAKPKSGRKSAVAKAKASQKKARPKRTEAELLEMLQKADIQV